MTMYALPTLTTWQNAAGGWSNSSGGPDNGTYPSSLEQVVFDANSGPARTINLAGSSTISCGALTMATCAAIGFNIPSGSQLLVYAGFAATDMTKCAGLYGSGTFSYAYNKGGTAQNFTPPVGIAVPMVIGANVTLAGPLVTGNTLTVNGGNDSNGTYQISTLTTNGWPVTVGTLSDNGGAAYYLGGGSWTVRAVFGQSSGSIFNPGNNFFFQGGTLIVDASNGLGPLTVNPNGGDLTGSVWFKSTPTGGYSLTFNPSLQLNNFRVDAGCNVVLGAGSTVQANTFTVAGTASSRIVLKGASTSTKSAIQLRSGAAQNRQYFDCADVANIDFSPAGIFYGRGCTATNCTGFTNTNVKSNYSNFL